ncbi:MAG: metallophosphoesterase [Planctomycetota bacterium]|nr:metallophosphoesterase [Planctomycetota bacterium]
MRLILTADLHFGKNETGDASTREMARKINSTGADALILAGDTAAFDAAHFYECFQLFSGFPGRKFVLCGNHDLWTRDGDSLAIYDHLFASLAQESGFEYLEGNPVVIDGIGVAGSIGWYDYSFRDPDLEVPRKYLEQNYHPKYARWNDGLFVKMDISDTQFHNQCLETLEKGIQSMLSQTETIVVVTHMIAFEEMRVQRPGPVWGFCNAFMGSRGLGELLLLYPQIRHHFCGHTHLHHIHETNGLRSVNIGSNYLQKSYEVLDL